MTGLTYSINFAMTAYLLFSYSSLFSCDMNSKMPNSSCWVETEWRKHTQVRHLFSRGIMGINCAQWCLLKTNLLSIHFVKKEFPVFYWMTRTGIGLSDLQPVIIHLTVFFCIKFHGCFSFFQPTCVALCKKKMSCVRELIHCRSATLWRRQSPQQLLPGDKGTPTGCGKGLLAAWRLTAGAARGCI